MGLQTTYREARSTTRVAEICRLPRTLSLAPAEGLQVGTRTAQLNQVLESLEAGLLMVVRKIKNKDLVFRNPSTLCGGEGRLQDRHTCEQSLGPRGFKLMFQFTRRVCDVGRCCDTIETVDCEECRDIVNLHNTWSALFHSLCPP